MSKPYVRRPEPAQETGPEKWLKRLGNTRDGVLMSISGIYVLGYGVWSYYAWQHGLGLRPALDVQYFVAGVFPAILLASVVAGIRWDHRVFRFLNFYLLPQGGRRFRTSPKYLPTLRRSLFVIWLLACCDVIAVSYLHRTVGPWWLNLLLTLISFYTVMLGTPIIVQRFVPLIREEEPAADFWPASGYSLLFGFLVLRLYVLVLYPVIPPALGGVRPQAATLDIVKAQVSPQTLAALLPTARPLATGAIARTVPVEVLFQGSSTILVRPQEAGAASVTYELKSGAVQGIIWSGNISPRTKAR